VIGKRIFDLVFTTTGSILLSPLLVVIAAFIAAERSGPILYSQERVGLGGRPFRLWKFRTMRPDSDATALLTVDGDERVTPVGRSLRKWKLDELPQLWNVLRGEMSLVGPRPEVSRYVNLYTPEQRRVLDLKPGITDPASLAYRDESVVLRGAADIERLYVEELMPDKIRLNLEYARTASVWSDFVVILRTIGALFR
jgi:lipopolysaccharide/colanic/teichoic acid biosynthesis glycosyltransferase